MACIMRQHRLRRQDDNIDREENRKYEVHLGILLVAQNVRAPSRCAQTTSQRRNVHRVPQHLGCALAHKAPSKTLPASTSLAGDV